MFFLHHAKPVLIGLALTLGTGLAAAASSSEVVAYAAVISAIGTLVVACITLYLSHKVKEVHVLGNARMTKVLELLGLAESKITASRESGQPVPPPTSDADTHDLRNL
jgi:hypothetical protein